MPKLTNKLNLPASLVAAIQFNDRDTEGCDYTITQILKPPRIVALEKLHADELTEDASDRIWALMGQAGHEVLRRYGKQVGAAIVEERAVVEVMVNGRVYKIGGQLDYGVGDKVLTDFKFVSIWAVKDGIKNDWEQQLNLYRWLASFYGVEFMRIQIVAVLRDWSVREAARDSSYPQAQVRVFEVKLWDKAECERFIAGRILLHEAAKTTPPECTSEEMWEKPERWAVIKRGNKRATRVYDNRTDAINHVAEEPQFVVSYRPAERPRCESYCICAPVCSQYKAWKLRNIADDEMAVA